MRTFYEIITDIENNKTPTHEECLIALIAYEQAFREQKRFIDKILGSKYILS